jgi:hypothetical protein
MFLSMGREAEENRRTEHDIIDPLRTTGTTRRGVIL